MIKIGLLSDTHSYLDPQIFEYFSKVDEIWHSGDFGNVSLSDELSGFKPLRGVYGNIDGDEIRKIHPLHNRFTVEGLDVWMTHIGGYPGRYSMEIRDNIKLKPPKLFITGHSHILKVMRDISLNNMLHINPGAAGKEGFHKVRTAVRFSIDKGTIKDLEVIELGVR
ncbi:MAG: metallophosphoesterase family protein [Bacteroidia bacterium]